MGKDQKRSNRSGRGRTSSSKTGGRGSQQQIKTLREFSAGGVVFRDDLWLIRSTKPSKLFPKSNWMLPKGWIDDAEEGIPGPIASGEKKATQKDLEETAIREVKEEGGVNAKIIKKIGTSMFSYTHPARGKILKFVTFFLMKWQKDLKDMDTTETSEVLWLSCEEAYKKLSFSNEKMMLKKAHELRDSLI